MDRPMSTRIREGGRLIDRSRPVGFFWNNRAMSGFAGDTLASALLANGQTLVGRSFKYHRPRGIVTSGPEEPNALAGIGAGGRFEPNQRATTVELYEGLRAKSQNHWPSLEFDIGAMNGLAGRFFPAGFYYKTFMSPRPAWKHVFEPVIRRAAGLGTAPAAPDPDCYEHYHAHADVLVVGGGIAGILAADAAAAQGARVLLVEQAPHFGGRSATDGATMDGRPAADWIDESTDALRRRDGVCILNRTTCIGVYDHGHVLACERLTDHLPRKGGPRQRLWRIRARRIVMATGAIERPLAFARNDVPGAMLASAVRDYVTNFGVSVGDRTVVVTNNDDAYLTAIALARTGLTVPAIIDARRNEGGELAEAAASEGLRVLRGMAVSKIGGGRRVRSVAVCTQVGEGTPLETIPCDAVAMSGGWSPAVHLWSHCGGKLLWDDVLLCFRPDIARPPTGSDGEGNMIPAGAANGRWGVAEILEDAESAGAAAARQAGRRRRRTRRSVPAAEPAAEGRTEPAWLMPEGAAMSLRAAAFLDFQNDVKVSDIELAAQEGFLSVEHAKRYTTLGMATDQGKLSNINGLAVLAGCRNSEIPEVGTTTFRPPYTPVSFGAVAGEAHGTLFKPMRETPMHQWHEDNGAYWEPVADWRRPYCYLRPDESVEAAVNREILNTRNRVGVLDASTLGKILVAGADAGRFLDMLYTGMMSTLAVGRCRYGLLCNENGFLSDDGVVARLGDDSFLCHTTSGGSDRIHAWMEEWLQTEWWNWKVYAVNMTEQYAQVGIVGPGARTVMERLGGMDVSEDALPFMSFADGRLAGIPARVFRISFSGELSYEVAVPARDGLAFWQRVLDAGDDEGIQPYGTEALHVMRAEKGFIMIGDETDGTVTPQDLGLDWAISRKKDDFLGKRAQSRPYLSRPDRWKLVGISTEDPQVVLPDGALATDGTRRPDGTLNTIGRITSSYRSPTLGRSIALALVERGPERTGELLDFRLSGGTTEKARVVSPRFLDEAGRTGNA